MPIQWRQDLTLGVPNLDAQHLELDRQLALVHDAICEGRVPDVPAVLQGVRRCSTRHFECEEAYMARCGHAAFEEHRTRHRQFTAQLERLEQEARREGSSMPLAMEVGNWLVGWIRDHQRYDLAIVSDAAASALEPGGRGP
jgi:hemerythrin